VRASTKLTDGPIDYDAVTRTQQATWSEGDFHEVARQNVVMAEAICTALDPHPGQRVLDVACGSGTAALVAARRYCEVAGIDYVPALVDRARQRAQIEGYAVDFRVGDAQELPFPDATFDAVVSVYGMQFAPDQAQAARELLRVCRPWRRHRTGKPHAPGLERRALRHARPVRTTSGRPPVPASLGHRGWPG
jgi:ubiquinone/menaquinone biosynthesis C-methylase UbiE